MKKPKKKKRRLLAVGYPWFKMERDGYPYDTVLMLKEPDGPASYGVPLNYSGLGNWKRIRLYAEYTE